MNAILIIVITDPVQPNSSQDSRMTATMSPTSTEGTVDDSVRENTTNEVANDSHDTTSSFLTAETVTPPRTDGPVPIPSLDPISNSHQKNDPTTESDENCPRRFNQLSL